VIVPTNGGSTVVDAYTNLLGFPLHFHGLAMDGAVPPWNRYGGKGIYFSTTNELKSHRLSLVRVTDEKGKAVSSNGASSSAKEWTYNLTLSNDVKIIDVTVALHHSRYVEFEAQPTPATNESRRR